jgi:hypothetical protein
MLSAIGIIFAGLVAGIWIWATHEETGGDVAKAVPQPGVALPPGTSKYLALGDSYSAGEGLGAYLDGTSDAGDRCHRSPHAYPELLGPPPVFRACSGARLPDLHKSFGKDVATKDHLGRQLSGRVDESVGLATVTLGGNDTGFARILVHCASRYRCMDAVFNDSFDDGKASGLTLDRWIDQRLELLETQLVRAYRLVKQSVSKDARVIVLGYPNLFPASWAPRLWESDCAVMINMYSVEEMEFFSSVQDRLTALSSQAARITQVDFVDARGVFAGHEPCARQSPRWIAFLRTSAGPRAHPGNFHPTRSGQAAYARAVSCYLRFTPTTRAPLDADRFLACARDGIF